MIAHIKILISVDSYSSAFNSKGAFHRYLSNSLVRIGGETNRSFYRKTVSGGFYYFNLEESNLSIHLYYRLRRKLSDLNVKSRIKRKLPGAEISIEYLSDFPSWISPSNGLIQAFGEEYSKI